MYKYLKLIKLRTSSKINFKGIFQFLPLHIQTLIICEKRIES